MESYELLLFDKFWWVFFNPLQPSVAFLYPLKTSENLNVQINPLQPGAAFLYPLKTSENLKVQINPLQPGVTFLYQGQKVITQTFIVVWSKYTIFLSNQNKIGLVFTLLFRTFYFFPDFTWLVQPYLGNLLLIYNYNLYLITTIFL